MEELNKIKTKEDITTVGIEDRNEEELLLEFNNFLKDVFRSDEFKKEVRERAKEGIKKFIANVLSLRSELTTIKTEEEVRKFRYIQYMTSKPMLDTAMEDIQVDNPAFEIVEVADFISAVLAPSLLTHTDEQIQEAFDKYFINYEGDYAITVEDFIKKYLELEISLNNAIMLKEELPISQILEFFAVCNIIEEQNIFIETLSSEETTEE